MEETTTIVRTEEPAIVPVEEINQWQNLSNQIQQLVLTVQSSLQSVATTLEAMSSTMDNRLTELVSTQQRTITELTAQITASQALLLTTLIPLTSTTTEQSASDVETVGETVVLETPPESVSNPVRPKRPKL